MKYVARNVFFLERLTNYLNICHKLTLILYLFFKKKKKKRDF